MWRNLFLTGIACLCVHFVFAQTFEQQCVTAHNNYRKLHGVGTLTADGTLTKYAQQWANFLAKNGEFDHRPNNKYGENLYGMYGSTAVTGSMPVKAWYFEIKKYDYKNPGFSMDTGHFTQVVWKSSTTVGCAMATNGTTAIVVANYDPPGNYIGQFPDNVLKKKTKKTETIKTA